MTSIDRLTLGGCIIDGFGGLDGITSLAGLDAVTHIDTLVLVNNDALTSLDGAPALQMIDEFRAGANPALSQATYDAFVAQFAVPPTAASGSPRRAWKGSGGQIAPRATPWSTTRRRRP